MIISKKIKIKSQSAFLSGQSDIKRSIYFFSYKINIINLSNESIKLLTRHWDIKDANGKINVIEGDGVIGEYPIIKSNDSYNYKSFCPLKTEFGSMRGFYTFSNDNGDIIKSIIPEFSLIAPSYIN